MKKEDLQSLVDTGLSSSGIADALGITRTKARYWLDKHGLKTAHKQKNRTLTYDELNESNCFSCKVTKPIDQFYKVKRGSYYKPRPYCKSCDNTILQKNRTQRTLDLKKFAVEYKGGKCIVCGYTNCHKAMDFHHLDSDEKEIGISKIVNLATSTEAAVRQLIKELDKCVLLCCRCHREYHAGFIQLPLFQKEPLNVVFQHSQSEPTPDSCEDFAVASCQGS